MSRNRQFSRANLVAWIAMMLLAAATHASASRVLLQAAGAAEVQASSAPRQTCAVGTYASSGRCVACPKGYTTAAAGAKSSKDCNRCVVGFGWNASKKTCAACARGTFGGGANKACTKCPAGTSTSGTGAKAASECTFCAAGFGWNPTTKKCVECNIGSFGTLALQKACVACPSGSTTAGKRSTAASACSRCIPGFGKATASSACAVCATGSWSAGGTGACTPCGAGKTTAAPGAKSAGECADDSVPVGLTQKEYLLRGMREMLAGNTPVAGSGLETWTDATEPCGTDNTDPWLGVYCDQQGGNVVDIREIDGDSAIVAFPRSWAGITSLQSIVLSSCEIAGPFPADWAKLGNLTTLQMSSNKISGPLPTWLRDLPTLESISLEGNRISGSLPADLATGAAKDSLLQLWLAGNDIEGGIPLAYADMPVLEYVGLYDNPKLTGCVPAAWQGRVNVATDDPLSDIISGTGLTGWCPPA